MPLQSCAAQAVALGLDSISQRSKPFRCEGTPALWMEMVPVDGRQRHHQLGAVIAVGGTSIPSTYRCRTDRSGQ